jgi:metal-responsive CopG/Arc/MetJ family transcriptional regulator
MKTIQITMDEGLLARLDADEETRRDGRSAVLRRAAAEYLNRQRRRTIASSYQRAYAGKSGLGREFEGWEDEGQWPQE